MEHEVEHEVIQQLMDFKLIHVIEPDTSAASGRPGRYEAYTLDFALFMSRGLEVSSTSSFGRRMSSADEKVCRGAGHSLDRARDALNSENGDETETVLDQMELEIGTEERADTLTGD